MGSPQIGYQETRAAALGRWEYIHKRLGINLVTTSHRKHTPCQGCGGRDRFRVAHDYAEHGRWVCSGGGNFQQGDGFALLGHVFGWTPSEQLKAVKDALGLDTGMDTAKRDQLHKQAQEHAHKLAQIAKRKEEQLRTDHNILDAMWEIEDLINYRQHVQRVGRVYVAPSPEERSAAQRLNICILEVYARGASHD